MNHCINTTTRASHQLAKRSTPTCFPHVTIFDVVNIYMHSTNRGWYTLAEHVAGFFWGAGVEPTQVSSVTWL